MTSSFSNSSQHNPTPIPSRSSTRDTQQESKKGVLLHQESTTLLGAVMRKNRNVGCFRKPDALRYSRM